MFKEHKELAEPDWRRRGRERWRGIREKSGPDHLSFRGHGLQIDSECDRKSLESFEWGNGMIWLKISENHPGSCVKKKFSSIYSGT